MKLLYSKKFILLVISLYFHSNGFSILSNDTLLNYKTVESGSYKRLSILPTGMHYEMLGNKKNSILISAQINHAIGGGYVRGHFSFGYAIQPKFNIEYRYYYNEKRRNKKNRSTNYRSLNYFGILSENLGGQFPVFRFYKTSVPSDKAIDKNFFRHEVSYLGPVYGIQRSIGKSKRIYWSGEVGIGYNVSKNKIRSLNERKYENWAIIGDFFSLGIVL